MTAKACDVFAITFDANQNMWLATLDGIGRFDGRTLVLYSYADDGPFGEIRDHELIGISRAGIEASAYIGSPG